MRGLTFELSGRQRQDARPRAGENVPRTATGGLPLVLRLSEGFGLSRRRPQLDAILPPLTVKRATVDCDDSHQPSRDRSCFLKGQKDVPHATTSFGLWSLG